MIPDKKLEQEAIQNYQIVSRRRRLQKQSLLAAKQVDDPAVQQTGGRISVMLNSSGTTAPKMSLSAALAFSKSRIWIPEFKLQRKSVSAKDK